MVDTNDDFSLEEFQQHLGPEDGARAHERYGALRAAIAPPAPSLEDRIAALAKRKFGKAPLRRR
jgi:hypothetical protein